MMNNFTFQFLGAIAAVGLSTLGFAQPQPPVNTQLPSGLSKPQPTQTPPVGVITPPVVHRPDLVQAPVGSATPIKQPGPVIERKNQNSDVSTSIMTNTSVQVAIQTIRSINESLDTTSSPGAGIDPKSIPGVGPDQAPVNKSSEPLNQSSNLKSSPVSLGSTERAENLIRTISDGAAYWSIAEKPSTDQSPPPPEFKPPPPPAPVIPPPPN
jgi:hypothetical protein